MKVLVLGIGNILFGDEGIGVHLCNSLKTNFSFESKNNTIDFIDGGTLAHMLIPLITQYDKVLILDTIGTKDSKIGDVYKFNFSQIPDNISWARSAHEVEMLQTLKMTELMGDLPDIEIIGITPFIIGEDTAFTLSNEILQGAQNAQNVAISHIKNLGFKVTKISDVPLQDLANNSYKGF